MEKNNLLKLEISILYSTAVKSLYFPKFTLNQVKLLVELTGKFEGR